jgi:hypothetical protein
MGWRLARSLEVLRSEINALAPGRSKASDGTIGDAAHASGPSDHNPNSSGVVCAFDATHDPAHGADMHRISEHIRNHPPRAAKYVIFNRRIAARDGGWRWEDYFGKNAHTKHMHVSVGVGPDGRSTGSYDDTSPWGIAAAGSSGGDDVIGLKKGDSGERVKGLQAVLGRAGFEVTVDGEYGPATAAAVLACRKSLGSTATDGDAITGYAYAQIMTALARNQADDDHGLPESGTYEIRRVQA